MRSLLAYIFGCSHPNYTFPQTKLNKKSGVRETTVSCLNCSKTIPYDFNNLGGEEVINPPRMTAPPITYIETQEAAAAHASRTKFGNTTRRNRDTDVCKKNPCRQSGRTEIGKERR